MIALSAVAGTTPSCQWAGVCQSPVSSPPYQWRSAARVHGANRTLPAARQTAVRTVCDCLDISSPSPPQVGAGKIPTRRCALQLIRLEVQGFRKKTQNIDLVLDLLARRFAGAVAGLGLDADQGGV